MMTDSIESLRKANELSKVEAIGCKKERVYKTIFEDLNIVPEKGFPAKSVSVMLLDDTLRFYYTVNMLVLDFFLRDPSRSVAVIGTTNDLRLLVETIRTVLSNEIGKEWVDDRIKLIKFKEFNSDLNKVTLSELKELLGNGCDLNIIIQNSSNLRNTEIVLTHLSRCKEVLSKSVDTPLLYINKSDERTIYRDTKDLAIYADIAMYSKTLWNDLTHILLVDVVKNRFEKLKSSAINVEM